MTKDEIYMMQWQRMGGGLGNGCGPSLMLYVIIGIVLLMLFTSCRSVKSVETSSESRKVSELVEQMDSLVKFSAKWQQDIYQRQTSQVDSIRQHERNDSSRSVVVNEKGDTIRERVEIYRYIERDHSTEKSESEVWMQKFHEVDSLLRISLVKQAVTDSLLREREATSVIEKKPGLIRQTLDHLSELLCTVVIMFLLIKFVTKRLRRQSD